MNQAARATDFFDPSSRRLTVSRDIVFDEKQPWDWTNADTEADQGSDSFIVHYELPDQNPTTGENAELPKGDENAELPKAEEIGDGLSIREL